MEKKRSLNEKNMKNQNDKEQKFKYPSNAKGNKDKPLPWWVELLFVQIGLPDKFLLRILKTNKYIKELIKNDKNFIFSFLFVLTLFGYFYPVVKEAKNKLGCVATAKEYIVKNKNIININSKQLKMLSTNFCNGGEEIYEIENIN